MKIIIKTLVSLTFILISLSSARAEFINWETPHVSPLELTPDGNKLLVVNTPNNSLEVFNVTQSGVRLEKSISVGLDPVSVRARSNTQAWVVNQISDSVSVVDLTSGLVIATLDTDDEPADIVFAGNPLRAFVSCSQSNSVMVFNPDQLSTPPQTLSINGEDPRALAVSRDGLTVYAAIFESGNGSTILAGGRRSNTPNNVVDNPIGPYGGVNPPPNSGNAFNPPINPAIGTPPPVGLIVRKDDTNKWVDDNNRDWSEFVSGSSAPLSSRVVGWDLPDRDIAIINTTNLSVSYEHRIMNALMAMAVNPANGKVTVVGTDSENHIRYEPNLVGTFTKVNMAQTDLINTPVISDLNPHLDYTTSTVAPAIRSLSIGDPRGIAWNSTGSLAYVTGMGSNNVAVMNQGGQRIATIPVQEGPTGIVLHETSNRAFVLNKFESSLSIIDTTNNTVISNIAFYDPTTTDIKVGRSLLYDTHKTSGLGQLSCASCHIDARHDRLSWDLGDPSEEIEELNVPSLNANAVPFHPMKGPMRTQTLLDIIGSPRMHFRGDKENIAGFSGVYKKLQGAENTPSDAEMIQLEAYLATIHLPPNPYRNLDNTMPTSIAIPGPGNRVGDPTIQARSARGCAGSSCHSTTKARAEIVRLNTGNMAGSQPVSAPPLRNMHELLGLHYDSQTASNAGFAFIHDGSFDPMTQGTLQNNNNLAFMLAFNGDLPQDSHAAVGKQVTINGAPTAAQSQRLNELFTLANIRRIGLVAKGQFNNEIRGFYYLGNEGFQSDRLSQVVSQESLQTSAQQGNAITFTAVPIGSEQRIGVDENSDGVFNNDSAAAIFTSTSWSFEQNAYSGIANEIIGNNSLFNGTARGGLTPVAISPALTGNPGTCQYLEFDGIDDSVNLGNPDALNLFVNGKVTLAAWIRPDSVNGLRNIVAHTHSTNPYAAVFLRVRNNFYEIGSWNGVDHLVSVRIPAEDVGSNTWVHLAGVYDGTAWVLYRNGVEIGRKASPIGGMPVDQNWSIGSFGSGNSQFFDGGIDEVHIRNNSLNSTEILALMNKRQSCDGLVTQPAAPTTTATSNVVSTIDIDGNLSGWTDSMFFVNDPDDTPNTSLNVVDFESAGIAHNDDQVFMLIQNRNAISSSATGSYLPWGWQTYLDTDNDPSTGFKYSNVLGAEYMIEGNILQSYKGNGTTWNWQAIGAIETTFVNNTIELAFDRSLIGNPQTMRVVYQGSNEAFGGNSTDYYPDGALDEQSEDRYFGYTFGEVSPHSNEIPVSLNQGHTVLINTPSTINLNASDNDNDRLSVIITNQPARGTVTVLTNNLSPSIRYTPTQGYLGQDAFKFKVNDGKADSNVATVQLNVIDNNTNNLTSNATTNSFLTVDGNGSDWNSLRLFGDDTDDVSSDNNRIDWLRAGIAHDADTVYLMYQNQDSINPLGTSAGILSWGWQAYLDTDDNPNTGYNYNNHIGADYLIEGNRVFKFNGGAGWDWVEIGRTAISYRNNVAELSFPRNWLGLHQSIKVAFFGNNAAYGGEGIDNYPDTGSFGYFFGEGSFSTNLTTSPLSLPSSARSDASHAPDGHSGTTVLNNNGVNTVTNSGNGGGGTMPWSTFLLVILFFIRSPSIVNKRFGLY